MLSWSSIKARPPRTNQDSHPRPVKGPANPDAAADARLSPYWPLTATVAVAAGLLAVIERVADVALAAVGANSTRMMQLELAASMVPQLFTSTKEAAPVPLNAIEVRLIGVVLLPLVTVTACAALVVPGVTVPKLNVVVERVSVAALTPVPFKVTSCVVGLALSVKTSVADLLPDAVGPKRVRIVQLADTARLPGQLLISENEVGFVPLNAMEVRLSAAVPELVRVMAWAGL